MYCVSFFSDFLVIISFLVYTRKKESHLGSVINQMNNKLNKRYITVNEMQELCGTNYIFVIIPILFSGLKFHSNLIV